MARPRTNESNWWRGEGEEVEQEAMKVLTAAATVTLSRLDPQRSNFVEVGDLISEGWLTSMRYAVGGLQQWEARYCVQHMTRAYIHLRHRRFSCSRNRNHPLVALSDDYPLECRRGQWGTRCLDLWDAILVRCTPRQRRIVVARMMGSTLQEAAEQVGLTSAEMARLEMCKVRKELADCA